MNGSDFSNKYMMNLFFFVYGRIHVFSNLHLFAVKMNKAKINIRGKKSRKKSIYVCDYDFVFFFNKLT